MPCLRIGSGTLHCAAPLHIVRSPRIVPVPLLSCVAVFVVGGEVRWGACPAPLFSLCVCCHSIVGLGLCDCGKVCGVWCVVSTHHPCCGVCVVMAGCNDSACLVLSHCVVGCGIAVVCGGVCEGCVVSSLLFLFLPLSLPLCVGVRGSARAALRARTLSPNTIVSPLLCSFLFSAPRLSLLSAFPVIVEWRCVIHHVSVCLVGMTAMGSLSRSSSFFW